MHANIHRASRAALHWDDGAPSAVSSYVHIEIQTTAHFPSEHLEYKNKRRPRGHLLAAKIKFASFQTPSSVRLAFPELYLPRIIVNCLLGEIYSARRRDS